MIHVNLNSLNPFRRSSEKTPTKPNAAPKPEPQGLLERSKDFFADTWVSTKKVVDDAVKTGKNVVNKGAQKGREVVEETLWGEYKQDWGGYGDRYENPDDANAQRESTATIEKRIASRSSAEEQALGKLAPLDQTRYKSLQTLIAADPLAKEALQTMLIRGRLPGDAALVGGGTLLANLAALADQKLASGLTRESLVSDLIQEVENPVVINQKDKNTCVATSSVMDLALRNPAEMVRLVSGLASPEGKAKLAGGKTIAREPKWDQTLGERTQSAHLLSEALMELGNGLFSYDEVNDKNGALGLGLYEGLFVFGANRILSQLHDRDYDGIVVHRKNADKVMSRLAADTAAGKRVPVGLAWGDGGHQIVAEGVKDGQVYYLNPHGNRERMPEAEFKSRLRSAHFY
ncbi:hypothetical protein D3C72_175910 [compost metagenome]